MKLVKAKCTQWNGNGFGTSPAEWVVEGAEYITVKKFLSDWVAVDTNTGKRLARAWTRKELIEILDSLSV